MSDDFDHFRLLSVDFHLAHGHRHDTWHAPKNKSIGIVAPPYHGNMLAMNAYAFIPA